jgi:hypothetical protein
MRRLNRASAIVLGGLTATLLALTLGCGQSAPTAPQSTNVTGRWVGDLPLRLPDEDWSFTLITLLQADREITGTMTSRDGVRRALNGSFQGERAVMQVNGLPGTSTCASIELSLVPLLGDARIERLAGVASGRCYGTVAGQFTLRRVD